MKKTLPLFSFTRAGSIANPIVVGSAGRGSELRIDLLRPAGPLLNHGRGQLRDPDVEIAEQRDERTGLIRDPSSCSRSSSASRVSRDVSFLSAVTRRKASSRPVGKPRGRLGALELDGRCSQQLVIAACQRGNEVRLRLVSLQAPQRRERGLAYVVVVVVREPLERRHVVGDRRRARRIHAHLPRSGAARGRRAAR